MSALKREGILTMSRREQKKKMTVTLNVGVDDPIDAALQVIIVAVVGGEGSGGGATVDVRRF